MPPPPSGTKSRSQVKAEAAASEVAPLIPPETPSKESQRQAKAEAAVSEAASLIPPLDFGLRDAPLASARRPYPYKGYVDDDVDALPPPPSTKLVAFFTSTIGCQLVCCAGLALAWGLVIIGAVLIFVADPAEIEGLSSAAVAGRVLLSVAAVLLLSLCACCCAWPVALCCGGLTAKALDKVLNSGSAPSKGAIGGGDDSKSAAAKLATSILGFGPGSDGGGSKRAKWEITRLNGDVSIADAIALDDLLYNTEMPLSKGAEELLATRSKADAKRATLLLKEDDKRVAELIAFMADMGRDDVHAFAAEGGAPLALRLGPSLRVGNGLHRSSVVKTDGQRDSGTAHIGPPLAASSTICLTLRLAGEDVAVGVRRAAHPLAPSASTRASAAAADAELIVGWWLSFNADGSVTRFVEHGDQGRGGWTPAPAEPAADAASKTADATVAPDAAETAAAAPTCSALPDTITLEIDAAASTLTVTAQGDEVPLARWSGIAFGGAKAGAIVAAASLVQRDSAVTIRALNVDLGSGPSSAAGSEKVVEADAASAAATTQRDDALSEREIRLRLRPKLFVLQFDGNLTASQGEELSAQLTFIFQHSTPNDEILVVLNSPGGTVTGYGHAASQLCRVKNRGIRLVVAVDEMAASGGYMMACVADHILAAPFAMVGSIGVVTEIPNFSRLLEKNHVDVYEMTAGKSKRTVTPLGKVTPEGVEKLQQQLHSIHTAFKMHITAHRPQLAATIDDVATGEAWLAVEAKGLGLVDEIMTSDEYIAQRSACVDVIAINPKREKSGLAALIAGEVRSAASAALGQVFGELGRSAAAAAVPRVLNVAPPFDAV